VRPAVVTRVTPMEAVTRAAPMLFALSSLALAACAGAADDLCARAVQHLAQCTGVDVSTPGTCDPERARRLLGADCASLAGARSASGFADDGWGDLMSWLEGDLGGESNGTGDDCLGLGFDDFCGVLGEPDWVGLGGGQAGLYAVDGTGCTPSGCYAGLQSLNPWAPAPSDGQTTVIRRFFERHGGPGRYFPGPRLDGGDSSAIRDQVWRQACDDYVAGKIGQAAFVGASRGAVIAIDAARRTQTDAGCRVGGRPLPILVIGAVDAVDTSIWLFDKRPPSGVPTYHRVKAQKWENIFSTVDIPGAVVSVAPATDAQGNKLDHIGVIFHPSSLTWLESIAAKHGLSFSQWAYLPAPAAPVV